MGRLLRGHCGSCGYDDWLAVGWSDRTERWINLATCPDCRRLVAVIDPGEDHEATKFKPRRYAMRRVGVAATRLRSWRTIITPIRHVRGVQNTS